MARLNRINIILIIFLLLISSSIRAYNTSGCFKITHINPTLLKSDTSCISFESYKINGITIDNEINHTGGFDYLIGSANFTTFGLSKDENYAVTYGSRGKGLLLWDINKRCIIKKFDLSKTNHYFGLPSFLLKIDVNTEVNNLTIYCEDEVFYFNIKTGEIEKIIEKKTTKSNKLRLVNEDGTIRVNIGENRNLIHITGAYDKTLALDQTYFSDVTALAIYKDILATVVRESSKSEYLIFYHVPTGKIIKEVRVPGSEFKEIVYLPLKKRLLTVEQSGKLRFWDISALDKYPEEESIPRIKTIPQIGHNQTIKSMHFSMDGKKLVSGDRTGNVIVWDLASALHYAPFKAPGINQVAFMNNDPNTVITVGDQTAIWDRTNQTTKKVFDSQYLALYNPECCLTAEYFWAGMSEKPQRIEVWDLQKGKQIAEFILKDWDYAAPIAISNSGKFMAIKHVKGAHEKIGVYDLQKKNLAGYIDDYAGVAGSASFTSDDKYLLLGKDDPIVLVIDIKNNFKVSTINTVCAEMVYKRNSKGDLETTIEASRNPLGRCFNTIITKGDLMFVGGSFGNITIWNYKSGELLRTFNQSETFSVSTNESTNRSPDITAMAVSSDDLLLATASYKGSINIWETRTGRLINTLVGKIKSVSNASFLPDGKQVTYNYSPFNSDLHAAIKASDTIAHTFQLSNLKLQEITPKDSLEQNAERTRRFKASPHARVYIDNTLVYSIKNKSNFPSFEILSDTGMLVADKGKIFHHNLSTFQITTWAELPCGWNIVMAMSSANQKVYATCFSTIYVFDLNGKLLEQHKVVNWNIEKITISYDGSIIALSEHESSIGENRNFNVEIVEAQGFKISGNPLKHPSRINTMDFHSSKPLLITTADDGVIRLWDYSKQELLCSFIYSKDDNYLTITPENYYFSTKRGIDLVGFEWKNDLYSFEQFDLKYNRPDIVLNKLGFAPVKLIETYYQAYQERLKTLSLNDQIFKEDFHRPATPVITDNIPLSTNNKTLKFNANVTDDRESISRLYVWINDVSIYGKTGIDLQKRKSRNITYSLSLDLSTGINKIQISSRNTAGTESLKETFYITYNPEQLVKPNLYIVGIGVSEYKNIERLSNCDNDVRELVKLYKSQEGNLFENIYIDTLINKDVRKEALTGIRGKLEKSSPDDIVIVLYSGHGNYTPDYRYYLFTHDINLKNIQQRGIAYEELEDLLDSIPARKKLLMINACKSGEYAQDKLNFETMQSLFSDLRRKSGTIIISSTASEESGFTQRSDSEKYSIFCKILFNILNTSSELTVNDLKEQFIKGIEKDLSSRQHPQIRSENLELNFRIW